MAERELTELVAGGRFFEGPRRHEHGGADGHALLRCSAPEFAEAARKAVLFTTTVEVGA
jgi:hypothetical protein